MILAETYGQLLASPGHWLFELTLELLTGVVLYPLVRLGLKHLHRRLDREHGIEHDDNA